MKTGVLISAIVGAGSNRTSQERAVRTHAHQAKGSPHTLGAKATLRSRLRRQKGRS